MEEERIDNSEELEEQPEAEVYTERPTWQVWLARLGLILFILFVLYQVFTIATGGKYANPWN
jgi:hypothetical protein